MAKDKLLKESVSDNLEIHFGIIASDVIVEAVIGDIAKFYGDLSIDDIRFAYEIYTPKQSESWKRPTKAQILRPVQLWFNKRIKIKREVRQFVQDEKDQEERKKNLEKYEGEALAVYRESVFQHCDAVANGTKSEGLNSWKGTIFQAHRIASKFLYWQMDEGTRHIVRERYRERYYRLKCASESGTLESMTTDIAIFSDTKEMKKRILADECVIECVRLGIEPKEIEE